MMFWEENKEWEYRPMLIEDTGRTVNYGDAYAFSHEIGNYMEPRKVMLLLCENSIGSIFSYIAALQNEIVPLMVDCRLDEKMVDHLISQYQPEYVALPQNMLCEGMYAYIQKNWTALWKREDYICFRCNLEENKKYSGEELYSELALLLTTSGSTGSPKLVRQSYKNIQSNAASIAEYLELTKEERPVTTLPMYYTYGLSVINSHLLVGAAILVTNRTLFDREFWQFIKEKGATSLSGVPYTYEMLKKLRFFEMELPELHTMTQAGGKLPLKLQELFGKYALRTSKKFVVMYGQTEATARMAYLPSDKVLEKCGSMGIPVPGGEFELIDGEGRLIEEPDVTGELVYRGANVTLGYALQRSDLVLGDERHGRLETGDMAKRDADGYYYIVGRKKRFLKIYGNRVNMDEIEQLLKQNYVNGDFACTGEDDHMVIYTAYLNAEEVESIPVWIENKMRISSRSITVHLIDQIPRNHSGKIMYSEF